MANSLFLVIRELFHQIDIPNDLFRIVALLIHSFVYQVAISGGESHCLFLTNDGDIYSWGKNDLGQLGDGTQKDAVYSTITIPKKICDKLDSVSSIVCGYCTSYAILKNGDVYAWGNALFSLSPRVISRPLRVRQMNNIAMISNGRVNCLAVNFEGEVFHWEDC
jgi:hypothetical protein